MWEGRRKYYGHNAKETGTAESGSRLPSEGDCPRFTGTKVP